MSTTPETRAKKATKDLIERLCKLYQRPYKLTWNAGAGYGMTTLDATGVIAGWAVAIEIKRFDGEGHLTKRQEMDLRDFDKAGAVTWVIDSERSLNIFGGWLCLLVPREPPTLRWTS